MAERIYTRSKEGSLEPLEEIRFSSEDTLQELIAGHPELLDGEEVRPGDPRRWILVAREQGIAADAIPDELTHVMEFLNEQMPYIEVLTVEIKQFRGESTQTLVPRVIGRIAGASRTTSGTAGSRRKLNREKFLKVLEERLRRVLPQLQEL